MSEPKDFLKLSIEEQTRIKQSGEAIVHLAQQSAGGLIIAPPPSSNGYFATGSYFVIRFDEEYWLATAHHVVESFEAAFAEDSTVEIHAGELRFNLDGRRLIRDAIADVCLISLARVEFPLTKVEALSASAGWPPPHPREGDYVAVSGYPAIVRERPTRRRVKFNALSAIFRVTQSGDRHCSCLWEREEWLHFDGPAPPELGTELGGMSGGPVLIIRGLGFPVVGAISEFQASFEILRVGLFQAPPFEPPMTS